MSNSVTALPRRRGPITRGVRYVLFVIAAAIEVPLVVALYLLIVLAGFTLGVAVFDRVRAPRGIASVWPELHQYAAGFPGGAYLLPIVVMIVAYLATRVLDRAVDSLRPA